ncbi:MAG: ABC transporter ATP-binding protein [Eubacteriaceae bacterium]
MTNALKISNLSKSYGTFSLRNVSFSVPKGTIVGFIGENGAGKTTTIKAILNLVNRESGTIEFFGESICNNEKKSKQDIGVVLDGSNFHDGLKVKEVSKIMKPLYQNWNNEKFESYLKRFSILENQKIKALSKGMKMKLQIAVALSHGAKLLILDEATSGLDPIVREEVLDIFMEFIQDEECSILLSSHITSDLDKIADYIVLIHDGEIIFEEEKDVLLDEMGIIKCSEEDFYNIPKENQLRFRKNTFGYEVLVRNKWEIKREDKNVIIDKATIEKIMLFYIKGEK